MRCDLADRARPRGRGAGDVRHRGSGSATTAAAAARFGAPARGGETGGDPAFWVYCTFSKDKLFFQMLPPNEPPSKASDDASSAASRYAFGPRAAAPGYKLGYTAGGSPLRGARALCGRPRGGGPAW